MDLNNVFDEENTNIPLLSEDNNDDECQFRNVYESYTGQNFLKPNEDLPLLKDEINLSQEMNLELASKYTSQVNTLNQKYSELPSITTTCKEPPPVKQCNNNNPTISHPRNRLDKVFSLEDDIKLVRGILKHGKKWKEIWEEYDLKHINKMSLKDRARSKPFQQLLEHAHCDESILSDMDALESLRISSRKVSSRESSSSSIAIKKRKVSSSEGDSKKQRQKKSIPALDIRHNNLNDEFSNNMMMHHFLDSSSAAPPIIEPLPLRRWSPKADYISTASSSPQQFWAILNENKPVASSQNTATNENFVICTNYEDDDVDYVSNLTAV